MILSMLSMATAALMQPAAAPPAPPTPPDPAMSVSLPRWLAGCWMAEDGGTRTEECWTVPRGAMLLGSSHSFAGDTSQWFEHMRIVLEGGRLTFIAQPGGAPPTRFAARSISSINGVETLEFVNADNDYPQRIVYRYAHARHWELTAEISMLDGSRQRTWTFTRPQ